MSEAGEYDVQATLREVVQAINALTEIQRELMAALRTVGETVSDMGATNHERLNHLEDAVKELGIELPELLDVEHLHEIERLRNALDDLDVEEGGPGPP